MASHARLQQDEFDSILDDLKVEKIPPAQQACPHAAQGCGGCLLQSCKYDDQLRAKHEQLRLLYSRDVALHPAPTPLHYRSRMDYVCAFDKVGLRARAQFARVIDVQQCPLLLNHAEQAYKIARDLILKSGLPFYNYVRNVGCVRYLVLRASAMTKEVMLLLTTTTPTGEHARLLQQLLQDLARATSATSVWWCVNDGLSDRSVGTPKEHLGAQYILDEIAGVRCKVGPLTFFQGNAQGASILFERAMKHVGGKVLDMCCGVGVLSLRAARAPSVTTIIGVDNNAESIAAARENIALNNIDPARCTFVCEDMMRYMQQTREDFDTIICDPARAGLGRSTCRALLALAPKTIVYISCNPHSHRDDLAILKAEYDVLMLEAYDLFPQTAHVEVLSVLKRKD